MCRTCYVMTLCSFNEMSGNVCELLWNSPLSLCQHQCHHSYFISSTCKLEGGKKAFHEEVCKYTDQPAPDQCTHTHTHTHCSYTGLRVDSWIHTNAALPCLLFSLCLSHSHTHAHIMTVFYYSDLLILSALSQANSPMANRHPQPRMLMSNLMSVRGQNQKQEDRNCKQQIH